MKSKICNKFNKAAKEYDQYAKVQIESSNYLAKIINNALSNFEVKSIIDIGAGTGKTTLAIKEYYPEANCTLLDISEKMLKQAESNIKDVNIIVADAEKYEFTEIYDLCISNLSVQWFENLKNFLAKIKNHCRYFAFSTLLDSSFNQYKNMFIKKNITPPTFEYFNEMNLIKLIKRYGKIIQKDIISYNEYFPNAVSAARQFKQTGANLSPIETNKNMSVLLSNKQKIALEYDIFFVIFRTISSVARKNHSFSGPRGASMVS
ncbi:MAG: methyltransferase domain-containing protein [Holosporales bacterium]|nr:methyltransferase domain-containing protein [Holosporales bacterium]